jgi:glycosyltransferase involved in cell wall biosynthesis
VVVARLSPEKDIATLLGAVALAAREHPPLRLEIAGDGPLRAELEAEASALGIADRVTFLGEVGDVPALLWRASLLALSSRTEGIALTLLEAMARGLPVVATAVGGNPEVVEDGRTGLLVPPGDSQALARAIVELIGDPERALRMGRDGRLRVERAFDARRMVADYEALYLDSPP